MIYSAYVYCKVCHTNGVIKNDGIEQDLAGEAHDTKEVVMLIKSTSAQL